ncbi:MAG: FAD-binding oxidoreductase [Pseudomonadota bacterium]
MTDEQTNFDVVVIGGGVVGSAAAFYLARRGATVALLERGKVGGGTSSRSFTWINATSKVADEAYHRLNADGCVRYAALVEEYGAATIGWHQTGMLQCARRSNESDYAAMREQAAYLTEYGYPHQLVSGAVLAALEPDIRFDEDTEAIYATSDAWLDAPTFTGFLADRLRAMGSMVAERCAAEALAVDDDGTITGVTTEKGSFDAPKVLVAAGPDTPEVLADLTGFGAFAARFPMNRVPGLLMTTPATNRTRLLRRIVHVDSGADLLHIRPAAQGGVRLGAEDTDGLVSETSSRAVVDAAADKLLSRAKDRLPAIVGDVDRGACDVAVGVRPYPSDGNTIAGGLPGSPGLYLIATHSGVTLAPVLGALMADVVIDGVRPAMLEPFSLDRFPGFG